MVSSDARIEKKEKKNKTKKKNNRQKKQAVIHCAQCYGGGRQKNEFHFMQHAMIGEL